MDKEKLILKYYQELVKLSQKDLLSSIIFFEEATTSMLLAHEFNNDFFKRPSTYETLLLWNLTYNNYQTNSKQNINDYLKPFDLVDKDYYKSLLDKMVYDPITLCKLNIISSLTKDLETKANTFPVILLKKNNPEFISSFKTFSKLKDILRQGWIVRKIDKEYIESDSTHSMQMTAFASAYFRLFEPTDLDLQKVIEMILIHEVGEILAGDIREGTANHDSKSKIEEQCIRNSFASLKSSDYFINLWLDFEHRLSNEAKFVFECDKIDPCLKAAYLDKVLNSKKTNIKTSNLFEDFYSYEENKKRFENGYLENIFKEFGKTERDKQKRILPQ